MKRFLDYLGVLWTESRIILTGSVLALGILLFEHAWRPITRPVFTALCVVGVLWATFRAWDVERRTVTRLSSRRLLVAFDPQKYPSCQMESERLSQTVFRLGVWADGSEIIRDVSLVLEDCKPEAPGSLREHRVRVMGKLPATDTTDVAPGDGPTTYFDVLTERHSANPIPDIYADWNYGQEYGELSQRTGTNRLELTVRVQGGSAPTRARFVFEKAVAIVRVRVTEFAVLPKSSS